MESRLLRDTKNQAQIRDYTSETFPILSNVFLFLPSHSWFHSVITVINCKAYDVLSVVTRNEYGFKKERKKKLATGTDKNWYCKVL